MYFWGGGAACMWRVRFVFVFVLSAVSVNVSLVFMVFIFYCQPLSMFHSLSLLFLYLSHLDCARYGRFKRCAASPFICKSAWSGANVFCIIYSNNIASFYYILFIVSTNSSTLQPFSIRNFYPFVLSRCVFLLPTFKSFTSHLIRMISVVSFFSSIMYMCVCAVFVCLFLCFASLFRCIIE